MHQQSNLTSSSASADERSPAAGSAWQLRYADRHRLRRLEQFPVGIAPPRRVRIYQRREHFVLQWWDKAQRRTNSERVDGDLLAALARAREIDERLQHFRTAGQGKPDTGHEELIAGYLADLDRRMEAGEVDLATARRYRSALQHYLKFARQPSVLRTYRRVVSVDHTFHLEFAAYLNRIRVGNGCRGAASRPMKGQDFVIDVVRSVFEWGADAQRGNCLPAGFRNPFAKRRRSTRQLATDPIRELDITTPMAVELIDHTDRYQLALFAPLLLYGLRPGELTWLFAEHSQDGWLRVVSIPELDYTTKGRRDKRFPLLNCLPALWDLNRMVGRGLIYRNRLPRKNHVSRLIPLSLEALVAEYRRRCAGAEQNTVLERRRIRDQLMVEAGQLSYDRLEGEFQRLARQLKWPAGATLKDLRHLFSTGLENAGVPESYRRYLMGHSLGKAPIMTYTHITAEKIEEHYQRAIATELAPIVLAIDKRIAAIGVQETLSIA